MTTGRVYTVKEYATRLQVSPQTIKREIDEGRLEAVIIRGAIRRTIRITEEQAAKYERGNMPTPAPTPNTLKKDFV